MDVTSHYRRRRALGRIAGTLLSTAAALVLAGCSRVEVTNTVETVNAADLDGVADASQGSPDYAGQAEQAGRWTASEGTDAMNDQQFTEATIMVPGEVNDVRVTVRCGDWHAGILYKFDGFDKQEQGAPYKKVFERDDSYNWVLWRPDREETQWSRSRDASYTNEAMLSGTDGNKAAYARLLTVRLAYTDAEETYRIDQTGPVFRNVVQPCLDQAADAEADALEQSAAEMERERGVATTAPPAISEVEPAVPASAGDNTND